MKELLLIIIGSGGAVAVLVLTFYIIKLFFRSIDNDIRKSMKELLTEDSYKVWEKSYYGLEDGFNNKL